MDILEIVRLLFIYAIAITIHEFSHAWMGNYLGDPTAKHEGRLTLNPAAHIDPFTTLALPFFLILLGSPIIFGAARPVPFNPYLVRGGKKGAALIALAGPASNLVLAIVVGLILRFVPTLIPVGQGIFVSMMTVNIALALFNLIPIPPLDGSRVLYAFAPPKMAEYLERFEQMGPITLLLIFIVIFPLISGWLQLAIRTISAFLLGISI
ncbi:MAG: site-2 protease family protein [bacterium]